MIIFGCSVTVKVKLQCVFFFDELLMKMIVMSVPANKLPEPDLPLIDTHAPGNLTQTCPAHPLPEYVSHEHLPTENMDVMDYGAMDSDVEMDLDSQQADFQRIEF